MLFECSMSLQKEKKNMWDNVYKLNKQRSICRCTLYFFVFLHTTLTLISMARHNCSSSFPS
jgi:hypothetical protein